MQVVVPTMVLVSLTVDHRARRATVALRPKGIVALVLGWFGMSKSQTYEADYEGYRVTTNSFSGESRTYIPWSHASGSSFDSSKPVERLIAGFGLVTGSLNFLMQQQWLYGGGMLLLGILLVLAFLMARKKTCVRILADSGASEAFKVHTTPEELEQLEEYYDLLRDLILASEGDSSPSEPKGALLASRHGLGALFDSEEEEGEDEPHLTSCPNCQVEIKIKAKYIGRRANCPACKRRFVLS